MNSDDKKKKAAQFAATLIKDGDVVGVGSGTTIQILIASLAERVRKEKLNISCVTASIESSLACAEQNLKVLSQESNVRSNILFDGADEVDPNKNVIKGRGGALLREKFLQCNTDRLVILVDDSKLVKKLGEKYSVPVQIFPEQLAHVKQQLTSLGAKEIKLRASNRDIGKDGPVITEQGHLLLDVKFDSIDVALATKVKNITGVVDHGIYWGVVSDVIVSGPNGIENLK